MSSIFDSLFSNPSHTYITPKADLLSQDISIESDIGEICLIIFSFNIFKEVTASVQAKKCDFEWTFNTTNLEVFKSYHTGNNFCIHFPSYGALRIANSLEQLSTLGVKKVYAVGLAGGLQEFLKVEDIILLEGSVRGDGVSRYYVPDEFPSIADFSLVSQLKLKLNSVNEKFYSGLSFGTDALYRENVEMIDALKELGVLSIDLESSALLTISRKLGLKACWVGVISDLLLNGVHKGIAHSEPVTIKLVKLTQYLVEIIESEN
jgi:uridine phosphorylase